MKAVVYTQYGSPEVLQHVEIEKPVPEKNEILVKIKATTVNRTDCANLSAKPFIMRFSLGLFKPKKQILGTEFAGVIEELGEDVTTFQVGERVFGFDDSGVYAEYMSISSDKALTTIPKDYTFKKAAACIEGVHYAYNFINKVELKKGDKVLVNGASGGIGSAAVQLLKYYEADITAVCNSKNLELVKTLGANRVIDYSQEDFTKDNETYNFVFDSVGKSTFGKCKHILKPGGVYISSELGWMVQNLFYAIFTAIFGSLPGQSKKKVKFPYPPDVMRSMMLVKKLIEEGKYKSVIDRSYPLEQIAEAFRYVERGEKTGNVVISVEN